MGRKLAVSTIVQTPPGSPEPFQVFGPDDADIPDWAAKQIGAHAWEGGVHPDDADPDDADSPPAKSAPKGDWITYAVSQGADQADVEAMTKEEIVTAYGDK